MAHVEKYTREQMGHICNHDSRKKDDGVQRSNENIDSSRTDLNYNLAERLQPLSAVEFIQKRVSEVYCLNRKNVNVLCSWVVTLPKDFEGDEKNFFQAAFDFLADRYGRENVVSAYVHRDEERDHMHFKFVPVKEITDEKEKKKKGCYKVCAKEILTRKELDVFHAELQKYLEEKLKCECHVLNGATANGNKMVMELKRQTLENKIVRLEEKAKEISEFIEQRENLIAEIERLTVDVQELQDKALAYEQKPRKPLETKAAYEERMAIVQQAVAVIQRTVELDRREEDFKVRKQYQTAIIRNKAEELYAKRNYVQEEQIKQLQMQFDEVVRQRDEALQRLRKYEPELLEQEMEKEKTKQYEMEL